MDGILLHSLWCHSGREPLVDYYSHGTTVQRGYGIAHRTERKRWQARIEHEGPVQCACQGHCGKHGGQCPTMINSETVWDLGHDDHDRTKWVGPECHTCNRAAGGITTQLQRQIVVREW
jgi:hypothetical protein